LTGAAETPPVVTTATGTAVITLDAANNITVTATFSGLSSPSTIAHLHGPAPTTTTGAVFFDLTPNLSVGVTSGAITTIGRQLTATEAANVRSGMTYINIHSMMHMSGEIRAQIQ
jgi:hypothetical protein